MLVKRLPNADNLGIENTAEVSFVGAMTLPRLKQEATQYFEKEELPDEFAWVDCLSRLNLRLFAVELKEALGKVPEDKGESLLEVVESWRATAGVDADPELKSILHSPRSKKKYREWTPPSPTR